MFDIITLGSATLDVFLDTNVHEKKKAICYPAGSKILVKNLFFSTGGGGTNTAVSFSRLGLRTGWLGELGNDEHAGIILNELKKERISFLGSKSSGMTGYSVVLDTKEKERTILTYKGVNDNLKLSDFSLSKLKTKWFYFSSMTGESFRTQEKLAEFAGRNKIRLAYNPSSYQAEKGASYLRKILNNTDILILNKEEAGMLVKKGSLLEGLHKLGPKIVCITDGKNGNTISDGIYKYISGVHNIKVVERTGAGDAFASGFTAGIIKGRNIELAIQIGTANAESVIRYYGAKNKILNWKEALAIIKKHPVRIKKLKI